VKRHYFAAGGRRRGCELIPSYFEWSDTACLHKRAVTVVQEQQIFGGKRFSDYTQRFVP
jgi:hypothetical protein